MRKDHFNYHYLIKPFLLALFLLITAFFCTQEIFLCSAAAINDDIILDISVNSSFLGVAQVVPDKVSQSEITGGYDFVIAIVDANNETVGTAHVTTSQILRDEEEEEYYVSVDTNCSGGNECVMTLQNWEGRTIGTIQTTEVDRILPDGSSASFTLQIRDLSGRTIQSKLITGTGGSVAFTVAESGTAQSIDPIDSSPQDTTSVTDQDRQQNTTGVNDSQSSGSSNSDPACGDYAGSIGWILCPLVEYLSGGADGIYSLLSYHLSIDPELLSGEIGEKASFKMWQYFRNVANIFLVIIILAIIFSQVTGFGIDNYGIKRMLPRLIVAGILINVSYFIVQLAVDASNVLGNSLSGWLDAVATSISSNSGDSFGWAHVLTLIIGIVAGTTSVAPYIGTLISLGTGGFWLFIIIFIIGLLVALISVLAFFIMIAARKIVVIGCAAIAPLAFVCYILPNTQNLFRRWLDLLKGMLIIYPLCSLLYGVSQLIKTIAFSDTTDVLIQIIALIAAFLPFAVAPSLLKKAFNSLGEVGARIQGLSHGLRGAGRHAQDSIRRSKLYQDTMRQASLARANNWNEKYTKQLEDGTFGRDRFGIKRGRLLRSRMLQHAEAERSKRENDYLDEEKYNAAKAEQAARFEESDIKAYMDQIGAGTFVSMDASGNTTTVDGTDLSSLENALQAELSKDGKDQDAKRATAIRRKLESFGDKGYDAVGRVIDSGTMKEGVAVKRMLDDVAANGAYKTSTRSVYDVAGHLQSEIRSGNFATRYTGGMVTAHRDAGKNIGNTKYDQIPDMSDAQFAALTKQNTAQAARLAYDALTDERVRSRLKPVQQQELAQQYGRFIAESQNPESTRWASEVRQNDTIMQALEYKADPNITDAAIRGEQEAKEQEVSEIKARIDEKANNYYSPEQEAHSKTDSYLEDLKEGVLQIRHETATASASVAAQAAQIRASAAAQQAMAQASTQRAHVERAQIEGRNVGGIYPVPSGFKVDLSANTNGSIFKNSSTGEIYDAEHNKFL